MLAQAANREIGPSDENSPKKSKKERQNETMTLKTEEEIKCLQKLFLDRHFEVSEKAPAPPTPEEMYKYVGFWVYTSWGFGMRMNGSRGHKAPSLESMEVKESDMVEICEAFGHEFRCVCYRCLVYVFYVLKFSF
jgi:hypothetical protein